MHFKSTKEVGNSESNTTTEDIQRQWTSLIVLLLTPNVSHMSLIVRVVVVTSHKSDVAVWALLIFPF